MRRQTGSIFVVALAILAGLIAILASAAATHELYMTSEANRLENARAKFAAESAVQYALEELYAQQQTNGSGTNSNSTSTATTPSSGTATTLQDDWAQVGQNGDVKFTMGNASFRMQIVDMASRLNLNTAPEEQLQRLPLTQEQIDSLLDFRTAGEDQRDQGGKDQYYNNLQNPYNAKLRNLDTFDELLQVKGFTPNILYQPQTNIVNSQISTGGQNDEQPVLADIATVYSYSEAVSSTGEQKINVNAGNAATKIQSLIQRGVSAGAAQIIGSQNFATLGALLTQVPNLSANDQKIILDNCTTSATPRIAGRINLNTATEPVLLSIPGMTSDVAQSIISQQTQGFTTLGDVIDVPGMSGQLLSTVDYFTVSSDTFLVRIEGKSGTSTVALQAIIDVQNGTPKIIQVQQPPYSDYLTRWNWATDTSSETVLKEAS